jgi:hypothetical protein
MKHIRITFIFTILIAIVPAINAQDWQRRVSIANGGEKTISGSGIKIKFLDVLDDSRCPTGQTCIWAGNAKIKISVYSGRRASTFELNSNLSPQVATIGGYEIKLSALEPRPGKHGKPDSKRYIAVFTVRRLTR